MENEIQDKDIVGINSSISLLKQYLIEPDIEALISALEALRVDPKNEGLLASLRDSLDDLGPWQGAALNYAPYIILLLSNDLLESH